MQAFVSLAFMDPKWSSSKMSHETDVVITVIHVSCCSARAFKHTPHCACCVLLSRQHLFAQNFKNCLCLSWICHLVFTGGSRARVLGLKMLWSKQYIPSNKCCTVSGVRCRIHLTFPREVGDGRSVDLSLCTYRFKKKKTHFTRLRTLSDAYISGVYCTGRALVWCSAVHTGAVCAPPSMLCT